MRKFHIVIMAFMVVALTLWTSTAVTSQEAAADKSTAVNTAIFAPRVSEAGFAREMAGNGRQIQDPYLLIQSAELMIAASKLPGPKTEVKSEKPVTEKKIDLAPADLLREAAKIAGGRGDHRAIEMAAEVARNNAIGLGDESLADEIARTETSRGVLKGRSWTGSGCLNAGEAAASEFNFNKNENAGIILSTGNSLPVDLFVLDKYGVVASDESSSADKTLAWHTAGEGKLKVALVANYGATCYAIYIP